MQGKIANKLLIADNEYNLEYALADTMLTPSVPSIDEPTYQMVADVNAEFITKFLKAKKALGTDVFIVEQGIDHEEKQAMKFTLGGVDKHTNKVNFTLPTSLSSVPGVQMKFPIEEFGEILAANKEIATGVLSVSEDGLLKIEFTNEEGVKVTYLLVGRE
jgi:hypothetical protein